VHRENLVVLVVRDEVVIGHCELRPTTEGQHAADGEEEHREVEVENTSFFVVDGSQPVEDSRRSAPYGRGITTVAIDLLLLPFGLAPSPAVVCPAVFRRANRFRYLRSCRDLRGLVMLDFLAAMYWSNSSRVSTLMLNRMSAWLRPQSSAHWPWNRPVVLAVT